MGRFCWIIILLFVHSFCSANEDIYLNNREKAIIAILLKTSVQVQSSQYKEAAAYLLRTLKQRISNPDRSAHEVMVKSYKEFLDLQSQSPQFTEYRLDELSIEQLNDLLQRIRYKSESIRVQNKIDRYEAEKKTLYSQVINFVEAQAVELATFNQANSSSLRDYVNIKLQEHLKPIYEKFNLKDTAEVKLIVKLIRFYILALPFQQKAEMVYRLSQISLKAEPADIFLVMIQNAGPQMQKLVQVFARSRDLPEELKVVLQRLESQVDAVPWWKVKKILETNGVDLSRFTYFERKPIGVGTMAQTHRVQYLDKEGRTVNAVLRFIKPQIEELLEMDRQILLQVAAQIDSDPDLKPYQLPSMVDLVDDLHQSVSEELILATTIQNQREAHQVYLRSELISFNGQKNILQFVVPQADFYGKSNQVMIQDLVFGKKPATEFAKYKEIYPDLYRVVSEKIAEMWFDEAFFKSGFFHADLHQGNILVNVTDPSIQVSILDFGMVGRLSKEIKESALMLVLGINLQKAEVIAHHFLNLNKLNQNKMSEKKFLELVQNRIEQLKKDPQADASFEAWTTWALEQGIEFNYEFLKLNRGLTAIQVMLSDSNSELSIQKIAQRVAFKNKKYLARLLINEPNLKAKDFSGLILSAFEKKSTQVVRCEALFK